ncbi:DUF1127 domain-containing protein [Ciceribacter naphthalenivorans]|uniref:DUF1127 domain-containing protein n=2 Tax=Alphaproteobacteria TaxID=28211 RepID=A0A512HCJ5_9HYPH|nr:hypothetical protein RNA01_01070 [Ciceribacter naphthalenivorans]GLR20430.1 hypothetical protein GCM10007920_02140 [Ciceribacter naphthalenivorans]GLT03286.1 hypothetical protein GCM10007926_02140 [Sphingomonas psychrolutea]
MYEEQSIIADNPMAAVDDLCQKFGVWASARALLYVAWRRRRRSNSVRDLSDRMRRDIGLPPERDWRYPSRFSAWDIRL